MPKVLCDCGKCINVSGIPSAYQYLYLSDIDFEAFHGTVDAEAVYAKMDICIQCPSCLRLHVYNNGFDAVPLTYVLENNKSK